MDRASIVVIGLAGAGIPSTNLVEGATATIVGIVRRPYPTANDRRFAILPARPGRCAGRRDAGGERRRWVGRGRWQRSRDLDLGRVRRRARDCRSGGLGGSIAGVPTVDLGALGEYRGREVRVGGLVVQRMPDGILLDDGTSRAWIVFEGAAIEAAAELAVDDAVEVTGMVAGDAGHESVTVDDPAAIIVAGRLDGGLVRGRRRGRSAPSSEPLRLVRRPATPASEAGVGTAGWHPVGWPRDGRRRRAPGGRSRGRSGRWWRERERRRVAARVAGRLEGLVGPFDAS